MMSSGPERAATYAAVAVLVLGPILSVVTQGSQLLSQFNFYFGLFGWLSAALFVAYVVWLVMTSRQSSSS